ncbi:hypothetical protein H6503_06635 [Candidatus Woesearchaeota archaeon]|nr:hypothetical protein [Candidatus Woesearchaeota archaeon]
MAVNTSYAGFWNNVKNGYKNLTIAAANLFENIRPESGPIDYLLDMKEDLLGKLGAPTGEVAAINQAWQVREYQNATELQKYYRNDTKKACEIGMIMKQIDELDPNEPDMKERLLPLERRLEKYLP